MWQAFADYHTHTRYSGGTGRLLDNVVAAQKAGLEIIGIAEHGPANFGHGRRTTLQNFRELLAEVGQLRAGTSLIKILAGVEANIINYEGELDLPQEVLQSLDQVLVGFHLAVVPQRFREGIQFLSERALSNVSFRIRQQARENNTRAIVKAVYRNRIDIITHPGLHVAIDTVELARACAQKGTALEINAKHGAESVEFIRTAAREGVKFVIGSDAHSPEMVGQLEAGIAAAQKAGLEIEQVLNVRE